MPARPATASYFRAGHLLLDSLTHSLQLEREIQALSASAAGRPAAAEPGHSAVSGQQPMGVGNLLAIPFGRLHDFRVPPKL